MRRAPAILVVLLVALALAPAASADTYTPDVEVNCPSTVEVGTSSLCSVRVIKSTLSIGTQGPPGHVNWLGAYFASATGCDLDRDVYVSTCDPGEMVVQRIGTGRRTVTADYRGFNEVWEAAPMVNEK